MTSHRFRAAFATLANESRRWHPDAIERQLAHVESNNVRRAYSRGEHWDERALMMQWWANEMKRLREAAIPESRKAGLPQSRPANATDAIRGHDRARSVTTMGQSQSVSAAGRPVLVEPGAPLSLSSGDAAILQVAARCRRLRPSGVPIDRRSSDFRAAGSPFAPPQSRAMRLRQTQQA